MNETQLDVGICIYKRIISNNYDSCELSLSLAITNGNVADVNKILNIYELDLQFIERSLNCETKFWLNNTIYVGFGSHECSTIEKLYNEYQIVETNESVNIDQSIVILLKRDNITPVRVICLSPKSEEGIFLKNEMVKSVCGNGCLDINVKNDEFTFICATAAAGMFDASIRIMHLGAEFTVLELVGLCMENGHLEYLEKLYKRFGFKMFDIFLSNDYFPKIFGQDNWPLFKYIMHAIMMEKQFSWRQIVNYEWEPVRNSYKNEHRTVFHHAISNQHYKIAQQILQYSECSMTTSRCGPIPFDELNFDDKSYDLIMKILDNDPSYLGVKREDDEIIENVYGVFHYLVSILNLEQIKTIFEIYPTVKNLYFKSQQVGLKYIIEMLYNEQYDLVKYILKNSCDVAQSSLYEILLEGLGTRDANLELFLYITSMDGFSFSELPIHVRNTLFFNALYNQNYKIFEILLKSIECNLNEIPVWQDINLLSIVLHGNPTSNQIFRFFLQKRVNFTKICGANKNLLHYSVEAQNLFTTKKLLELNVDMDRYDRYGKLPIHYAKTTEIFKLLNTWTSKSYVNIKTKNGATPLHLCMLLTPGEATNQLFRYILDNGGNINARDGDRKTPLFRIRDAEQTRILLEYRPDLNAVDKNGLKANYVRLGQ